MMTKMRKEKKEYYDKILRPHWSAYQQQQQQQQCEQKKHRPSGRPVTVAIHNPLPILSAQLFRNFFDDNGDDDSNNNNTTKERTEQDVDGFCYHITNNSTTNNTTNNTTKVEQLKQKKKHLEDKFITLFELILAGPPEQQQQQQHNDCADTMVRSQDQKNTYTNINIDQDQNTTATSTTAATSRCRSSCFSVSSSSSSSSSVYASLTAHHSSNLEGNMVASTRSVIHLNQQRDTYYQTYHRCRRHNQYNTHNDCTSNKKSDEDNATVPTCIAIHCGFTTTNDSLENEDDDAHNTPSIITDSHGIETHSSNNNNTYTVDTHCSIRGRGTQSDQCSESMWNSSKTSIEDKHDGSPSTTIPAVAMETGTATCSVLQLDIPNHIINSTTRTATTTATRHRWNCCDFLPLVPN